MLDRASARVIQTRRGTKNSNAPNPLLALSRALGAVAGDDELEEDAA